MSMMIIKCLGCKTKIEMDHPRRRLCIECKSKRIKDRNLQSNRKTFYQTNKQTGICVVCDNEFLGVTRKRLVCGVKCKIIRKRITRRSRENFHTIKTNLFKSWVMWGEK